MEKSTVFFTKKLTPEALVSMYDVLGRELKAKVAVKISTGEPGGHNYLKPEFIGKLVSKLNGTITECCTAYRGKRFDSESHRKAIKQHGFTEIAPCDIMDEEGEIKIPVPYDGKLHGYNIVGSHINDYSSMLMLSHFKGHAMGGFGGALKNMSIGVASRNGKAWIHSVGRTEDPDAMWNMIDDQDGFLECMAEACLGVVKHFGEENMAYINVANRLSIDCDCDSNPHEPEMADIGIFASLDPVALDRACYDAIMNSPDKGKASLVKRMLDKHAIHLIDTAEKLGLGTQNYVIKDCD